MSENEAFDKSANTGFTHLMNATRFSLRGLREAVRRESAFRQELALLAVLVVPGAWITQNLHDFVILMAISTFVLVVELLNSAVEAAIDRIGPEYHEMSGLAKDYGSAAVMLALLVAGGVWAMFAVERLS